MVAVGTEVEATASSSHHTVSTSSPVSSRDLATSTITTSNRCRVLLRHLTLHNNSSMAPAPTTSTTTTTKDTRRPQATNKQVTHNNSRAMDRQPSSQHTRIIRIITPVINSSNNNSSNTADMALVAGIKACGGEEN